MKALFCLECSDIIAPYPPDRPGWRRCACGRSAARWLEGKPGELQISAARRDLVRVIGFDNRVLMAGARPGPFSDEEWRAFHAAEIENVPPYYLFHKDKRACWVVIIAPGETGDVHFVKPEDMEGDDE